MKGGWKVEVVLFTIILIVTSGFLWWMGVTYFIPEGVLVTVLVLAFYLIFTGKIAELRVPGFLQVKLREAGLESPDIIDSRKLKYELPKMAKIKDIDFTSTFIHDMPVKQYDTLVLRESDRSEVGALIYYLSSLLRWPSFRNVVFLRGDDILEGFMPAKKMLVTIENVKGPRGQSVHDMLRGWEIDKIPGMITRFLRDTDSYGHALKVMRENKTDMMPVINDSNQLIGFINRLSILEDLLFHQER